MLLRSIRAELMKCRRSPVWLAFVVLPLFPAILGTVNYLGNLEVLESQWYSLWTQHVLFASLFFLPAQLWVFCAWQWRLEHTDHNWNQAMTAPVPARDLYLAKLVLAAWVSFLAQSAIGALFVLSGKLAGLTDPLPPELPGWLFFGALGGAAVCALQLYLSLVIRAFAIPVAIALVGGHRRADAHLPGAWVRFSLLPAVSGDAGQQPHDGAGSGAVFAGVRGLCFGVLCPVRPVSGPAGCVGGVGGFWGLSGNFAAPAKEQDSALRGGLLCPWRLVVAKSTPLRFRPTAKTAFVPLLLLVPANPFRWASPGVTRDWTKRHRGRGRRALCAHRTAFPGPRFYESAN